MRCGRRRGGLAPRGDALAAAPAAAGLQQRGRRPRRCQAPPLANPAPPYPRPRPPPQGELRPRQPRAQRRGRVGDVSAGRVLRRDAAPRVAAAAGVADVVARGPDEHAQCAHRARPHEWVAAWGALSGRPVAGAGLRSRSSWAQQRCCAGPLVGAAAPGWHQCPPAPRPEPLLPSPLLLPTCRQLPPGGLGERRGRQQRRRRCGPRRRAAA
jgi:hypothetical protein